MSRLQLKIDLFILLPLCCIFDEIIQENIRVNQFCWQEDYF